TLWMRAPKPPMAKVPPEILAALIGEARAAGLRVSVHAPNLTDAQRVVSEGVTALAHSVLEPLDERPLAAMKAGPVFYLSTLDIFEFLADTRRFVDRLLSDERATRRLPAEIVARYRSDAYSDGYRERYPNFANIERHLPSLRENLRRLHAAGVPVALGTDMWAFPGLGVSIEMD